jgi:hypothetical protein
LGEEKKQVSTSITFNAKKFQLRLKPVEQQNSQSKNKNVLIPPTEVWVCYGAILKSLNNPRCQRFNECYPSTFACQIPRTHTQTKKRIPI